MAMNMPLICLSVGLAEARKRDMELDRCPALALSLEELDEKIRGRRMASKENNPNHIVNPSERKV